MNVISLLNNELVLMNTHCNVIYKYVRVNQLKTKGNARVACKTRRGARLQYTCKSTLSTAYARNIQCIRCALVNIFVFCEIQYTQSSKQIWILNLCPFMSLFWQLSSCKSRVLNSFIDDFMFHILHHTLCIII